MSTEQPTQSSYLPTVHLPPMLSNPIFLGFCAIAVVMMAIGFTGGKKKGILATAYWSGSAEIQTSRKLALEQIKNQVPNQIGVVLGTPEGTRLFKHSGKTIQLIPEDPKRLYLSDLQESAFVVGGPGSGKSRSIADPAIRNFILQGKSLLIFDVKGHEEGGDKFSPSSPMAALARSMGYQVYILAPGAPESDCLNILDFLDDHNDADNAFQLGDTLVKNFGMKNGSDPFFEQNGARLCQAILMLVKQHNGDIALAAKLLALEGLIKRLQNTQITEYQRAAFDTFLGTADSPETAASIAATAQTMFSRFMSPEILSVFGRKTTIPLELHGKTMLIFRANIKKKALVMPLIAAAIDGILRRSIFTTRHNSIVTILDEVAMMKLEDLDEFLNTGRSAGSAMILLTQSIGLMESRYGKEKTQSIMGGCGTLAIGKLNENYTAKYAEERLGHEDLTYRTKGSSSGKGSDSTSSNEQRQTKPLMEAHQWGGLLPGEFVFLNQGQRNKKRTNIPYRTRVSIPRWDDIQAKNSIKLWKRMKAERVANQVALPYLESELQDRRIQSEQILPLPPDQSKEKMNVAVNEVLEIWSR